MEKVSFELLGFTLPPLSAILIYIRLPMTKISLPTRFES